MSDSDRGLDLALDLGLDVLGSEAIQRPNQPTPRAMRRQGKEGFVRGLKKETLRTLIPTPPAKGECIHAVSNGAFDYFGFIRLILDWIGRADVLYGSTWTMNRGNVNDLLKFYDDGKIGRIAIASGNY